MCTGWFGIADAVHKTVELWGERPLFVPEKAGIVYQVDDFVLAAIPA